VAILLAPVTFILGLAFIGGSSPVSAAGQPNKKGTVAIAFISSFGNSPSAPSFQRISLNVISVRLNPSNDPNISDYDSRWVTIGVPAGVGRSFGVSEVYTGNNFGSNGTSVAIGEGRSEIQIDLNAIQNVAEIFNAQSITAKTYQQVELVLDSATPGNVVPLCPQSFPAGEGCIVYPAKFQSSTPTPTQPQTIRTLATIDVAKQMVTPLVIAVDPGIGAPPTTYNQSIIINPSISVIPNGNSTPPFSNPALGSIQGTVTTNVSSGFSGKRPESIAAEMAGTNNVVETITLPKSCNGKKTCDFIIYLPAADESVGGTNYDLVASGKSTSYAVRSSVNIAAGLNTDIRSAPLEVESKSVKSFTGKVTDFCTGVGVQAATLNLLVPDPAISPTPDCTANPPTGCVVAATASTDEIGDFPMPGNGNNKAAFNVVPVDSTAGYELVTTAAGFDRTLVPITVNHGTLKCPTNSKKTGCNVAMSHGRLSGNILLGSDAVGQETGPLSVLVVAEDSGTNNIENLTMVTVPSGATTVPFTMNVPDNTNVGVGGAAVTKLDLFASAQDLFNGAPQKATGHSIAVSSGVDAPAAPVDGSPPVCDTAPAPDLGGIACVGHGSASGTVTGPTGNTTVVVGKADDTAMPPADVLIESVPAVPPGADNAGHYALCAPAGSYTLYHYENDQPTGYSTAVALATPVVVPTASPSPGASPTPCPSICDNAVTGQSNGCLTCVGTSANVP
jgi:hypothetical protein